jgi:hypothetical protein
MLVSGYEPKNFRYAFIGTDDWYMYPILQPGSLVLIDDTRRKILNNGWAGESDRPIYLLEHRSGWVCAWANLLEETLIALPHPSTGANPLIFNYPNEVEVIGQVVGVANRLTAAPKPRTRASAV